VSSTAVGAPVTERLRYKDDVIVGSLDVAGLRNSFVAARKFVTRPSELTDSIKILGITIGSVTNSTIFTGRWLNARTTLQICVDNIISTAANCPNAATSIRNYSLTFDGAEISAFDSVNKISAFSAQTYAWGASNKFPLTSSISDTLYSSTSVGPNPYVVNAPVSASFQSAPSVRSATANNTSTPASINAGSMFVVQGPLLAVVGAKNSPFTGRVEVSMP
jgi:hypothetical protein